MSLDNLSGLGYGMGMSEINTNTSKGEKKMTTTIPQAELFARLADKNSAEYKAAAAVADPCADEMAKIFRGQPVNPEE